MIYVTAPKISAIKSDLYNFNELTDVLSYAGIELTVNRTNVIVNLLSRSEILLPNKILSMVGIQETGWFSCQYT